MPAPLNSANDNGKQTARRENAVRLGRMGAVIGGLAGLLTGAGPLGALKFALMAGGLSAVGGAVAGDKINPLLDKVLGKFGRNKQGCGGKSNDDGLSPCEAAQLERGANNKTIVPPSYQPVASVSEEALASVREATAQSLAAASANMDPSAEPEPAPGSGLPDEFVRRHATPTHPGSHARH